MGSSKAWLTLDGETMLQRVVRRVSEVVEVCVVVAAVDKELPPLPAAVRIARDARAGRGPLEGLAAALRAAGGLADAWFVTSCDTPLVEPRLVSRLFELLEEPGAVESPNCPVRFDAVVPVEAEFPHPLSAVYRTSILPQVESQLADDRLRLRDLLQRIQVRRVAVDELRPVDPSLGSFRNLNTPDEYQRAVVELSRLHRS